MSGEEALNSEAGLDDRDHHVDANEHDAGDDGARDVEERIGHEGGRCLRPVFEWVEEWVVGHLVFFLQSTRSVNGTSRARATITMMSTGIMVIARGGRLDGPMSWYTYATP